ncbi:MAG: HEAT repeat domain-containing protein [Gaiellaceae bacterium]
MAERLVVVALAVEAAALLAGLLLLAGHGAVVKVRGRVVARRLAGARSALAGALEGDGLGERGPELVAGLPVSARLRLIGDLKPTIAGARREVLTELAAEAGLLADAERRCRSRRWKQRLRGARLLTLLGGGEDVVPRLFDDRIAEVRAQAAEWAAGHPRPEIVARLLCMLTDSETACRFTVRDSLLRVGRPAIGPLAGYLEGAGRVQAAAALEVAVWLPDPAFLPSALRLSADPEPRTRVLSATLLGALGGPDSVERLLELLDDDQAAEVRAAAAQALGKAYHWPAAARLVEVLRDSSWDARLQAGLALRKLGGAGELMLRRALADHDRFAADMARLMLDLPAGAAEPA